MYTVQCKWCIRICFIFWYEMYYALTVQLWGNKNIQYNTYTIHWQRLMSNWRGSVFWFTFNLFSFIATEYSISKCHGSCKNVIHFNSIAGFSGYYAWMDDLQQNTKFQTTRSILTLKSLWWHNKQQCKCTPLKMSNLHFLLAQCRHFAGSVNNFVQTYSYWFRV